MTKLINALDTGWQRIAANVREAAGRIWSRPLHRYYTDHTLAHSERVIALLDGLTAGMMATDKRLAPAEIFVLLAGSYLHDIGMQDERFAGGDLEAIRASHHEVSAELIYRAAEDPAQAVSLGLPDDPGLVEAVALVAKGHRKVDLDAAEYDPLVHADQTLRLRLLAALLRFGDELDVDHRRVDLQMMKLWKLPPVSQLHWWKCHYVSGVSIEDEYIRVAYRFPHDRPDYEGLIVSLVEGEVRGRLGDLEEIFRVHAVKVAMGKSQVRLMRLVQAMPPELEAMAREQSGKEADSSGDAGQTARDFVPPSRAGETRPAPAITYDQREQQVVGTQINVAGSYVDQRQVLAEPPAQPRRQGHEPQGLVSQPRSAPSTVGQPCLAGRLEPPLAEALQRRTLALFLGADLPREATGLPSRADLARELARRHTLDEGTTRALSLAEVAQRVSQAGNRFDFTDFIRNALDITGIPPQPFHQRLAALVRDHHVETIITTAYDSLLEIAFQAAGVGLNRVVRGGDASFIAPDQPTLIYLYGKADQPDTLVVTDRDHSALLRDRDKEALIDEVRQALRRKTVYFLGYNLADPDFRFLFDQVAESRFARTAYAVWPGLPEADVRMWRDRGVKILEADPLGVLGGAVVQTIPPGQVEAEVDVPAEAEGLTWDTETLRRLLTDALGDEELDRLCYDHFRSVYDEFGTGMGKGQKVHRLLEYCDRQGQAGKLLALVKQRNPVKFAQFAAGARQ